jgi:hypothetical protein
MKILLVDNDDALLSFLARELESRVLELRGHVSAIGELRLRLLLIFATLG